MLVLSFPSELFDDLSLLRNLPQNQLLNELLILAGDVIHGHTIAQKLLNKSAARLEVEPLTLQKCIDGLAALIVISVKKNASIIQFSQAIGDLGLPEENNKVLVEYFETNFAPVRASLLQHSTLGVCYKSFEWRLDVELGSRSCRETMKPSFMCALTTTENVPTAAAATTTATSATTTNGEQTENQDKSTQLSKTHVLQCDFAMLSRMHDELSIALNETKTAHARRIQRYVQ